MVEHLRLEMDKLQDDNVVMCRDLQWERAHSNNLKDELMVTEKSLSESDRLTPRWTHSDLRIELMGAMKSLSESDKKNAKLQVNMKSSKSRKMFLRWQMHLG